MSVSCCVRGWKVFGPGFHKGTLYTPADCRAIVENFRRLQGVVVPVCKIGHDKQQRLARSLGFVNVGRVVGVRLDDDDCVVVDIADVPVEVGQQIAAGRLNSGSIELLGSVRDPRDPGKEIRGPVLVGVAFLGEEQPAVKGFPPPVARFADGRPVPPGPAAPWLEAMGKVALSAGAAEYRIGDRVYSAHVLCFSEMELMDLQKLKAELEAAGLPAEHVAKAVEVCSRVAGPAQNAEAAKPPAEQNETPPAGNKMSDEDQEEKEKLLAECEKLAKQYADDPEADEEKKLFGQLVRGYAHSLKENDDLRKEFASVVKRLGALEAAQSQEQKKKDAEKESQFSEMIARENAKLVRKFSPRFIEKVVTPRARDILRSQSFSSESERLQAFSEYYAGLQAHPDNPHLSDAIRDSKPSSGRELSPNGMKLVNALEVTNPRVKERFMGQRA